MSMLDRYRKSGGFVQLLTLIETCGPVKQEKFLEIIRSEDPEWADAIRCKMLDLNRILSWHDDALSEILGTLQDLTLAFVLQSSEGETKERLTKLLPSGRRRKLEDLDKDNLTPAEIATAQLRVVETVRRMAKEGQLRFDNVDALLMIEEDIEDKIKRGQISFDTSHLSLVHSERSDPDQAQVDISDHYFSMRMDEFGAEELKMEVTGLKKKLVALTKENATLKAELAHCRSKLDQIRKIA
jgi:hypothetical protein